MEDSLTWKETDEDSGNNNMVLGGSFWADVGAGNESQLDELLSKAKEEVVHLEHILDEPTVLQEVTAPNKDLLDFLIVHLDELLDYVTLGKKRVEEEEEEDSSLQFTHSDEHYAYLSCEIINGNSNAITNAILKNEKYLERLFQILDLPSPINGRSAGYFHMILLMLCQRDPTTILKFASKDREYKPSPPPSPKSTVVTKEYERGTKRRFDETQQEEVIKTTTTTTPSAAFVKMGTGFGLIPAFLRHVDSYSIACAFMVLLQSAADQTEIAQDVSLARQIRYSEGGKASFDDAEVVRARKLWTGGYGTSFAVLSAFRETDDPYSHSNIADLLVELFRRAASARKMLIETMQLASLHVVDDEQQVIAPFAMNEEDLIRVRAISPDAVEDEWTISIVDEVCNLIVSPNVTQSARDAASKVLSAVVIAFSRPFSSDQDSPSTRQDSCPEIDALLRRLPELILRLNPPSNENDVRFLDTQWGGRIEGLGMGRLLLVEVLANLIICGHKSVAKEMAYLEPCPVHALLDMFFKFEWNNVLHSIVEKALKAILLGQTTTVLSIRALPSKDSQEQAMNNEKAEKEKLTTLEALLPLQRVLFSTTTNKSLIERILDAFDSNEEAVRIVEERYVQTSNRESFGGENTTSSIETDNLPRHGQKGYMGHLRNIANACAELIESQNERGGPAFDALGESIDLKQRWFDFVEGKLAVRNQIVSKPLGGGSLVKKPTLISMGNNVTPITPSFSSALEAFGLRLSNRQNNGMDFEEEPEDDEDEDDDDDEKDPEQIMREYRERGEKLRKEAEAAAAAAVQQRKHNDMIIASSPQDSSWDDFSDETFTNYDSAQQQQNNNNSTSVLMENPVIDGTFFSPKITNAFTTSTSFGNDNNFDDFGDTQDIIKSDDNDTSFDPFGQEEDVTIASKTTSKAIGMPIKKSTQQQQQQQNSPSSLDELGVSPGAGWVREFDMS